MSDSNVVAGPWPGSSRATAPARAVALPPFTPVLLRKRRVRGGIPHRYHVGKHGPTVLMDCRECRTPWAPDVPVPRDRLCRKCRGDADEATPALFDPSAL